MNQKSRYVLRIVVSLYLAYLGVKIILDVMDKKPENIMFMLVMAGIFIVTGIMYGIFSAKRVWALRNEEAAGVQDEGEYIEEDKTDENNSPENENDNDTESEDIKDN